MKLTWCNKETTHASARGSDCNFCWLEKSADRNCSQSASEVSSRFRRMNFAAFQSLFVKFLLAVTLSKDKFKSCPGEVPANYMIYWYLDISQSPCVERIMNLSSEFPIYGWCQAGVVHARIRLLASLVCCWSDCKSQLAIVSRFRVWP